MFPTLLTRQIVCPIFLLLLGFFSALAQTASEVTPNTDRASTAQSEKETAASSKHKQPEKKQPDSDARSKRWLQSNNLLVETPYTQERGEAQHTFTFGRTRHENWASTFTQEWPLLSEKHQLTFSLPMQIGRNDEGVRGVGDAAIEYTYQLIGTNESRITISPKVGFFVPTGDVAKELGIGAPGFEFSVPAGVMLSSNVGILTNVSASIFGRTKNSEGELVRHKFLEVGQSLVWYARPRFNALLEAKWERAVAIEDNGHRLRKDELFIAPGIRWAHLAGNKVAFIPGISVPLGIGPSRRDCGILFSLAIEHPFGKRRE